jgi:putative protease
MAKNVHLPLSSVNALRREALEKLEEKLSRREKIPCAEFLTKNGTPHIASAQGYHIRVGNSSQIPKDLHGISRVILPLGTSEAPELPPWVTAAVEIPRGVFGDEAELLRELNLAKGSGFAAAVVSGPDGAALAKRAGLAFSAGLGSNICNTLSLKYWEDTGASDALISPELNPARASALGGTLPRSVFAYGRLPLMLLRRCPARGQAGCASCERKQFLIDRRGKSFPLQCGGRGYSEILACSPVCLAGRQSAFRFADALLLYFTDESPEKCGDIIDSFRTGKKSMEEYTKGLPGWVRQFTLYTHF